MAAAPLPESVVLDASALMTFFLDRPGAEKIEELLDRAAAGACELAMSVVNWGEVYYSVWRGEGEAIAQNIVAEIAQLPIDLIPATYVLTKLAAELHARHKLPFADCFAAALSASRDAPVATSDTDFVRVQNHIQVLWVK
jgi:predicted nucleic acid-binding protein